MSIIVTCQRQYAAIPHNIHPAGQLHQCDKPDGHPGRCVCSCGAESRHKAPWYHRFMFVGQLQADHFARLDARPVNGEQARHTMSALKRLEK